MVRATKIKRKLQPRVFCYTCPANQMSFYGISFSWMKTILLIIWQNYIAAPQHRYIRTALLHIAYIISDMKCAITIYKNLITYWWYDHNTTRTGHNKTVWIFAGYTVYHYQRPEIYRPRPEPLISIFIRNRCVIPIQNVYISSWNCMFARGFFQEVVTNLTHLWWSTCPLMSPVNSIKGSNSLRSVMPENSKWGTQQTLWCQDVLCWYL